MEVSALPAYHIQADPRGDQRPGQRLSPLVFRYHPDDPLGRRSFRSVVDQFRRREPGRHRGELLNRVLVLRLRELGVESSRIGKQQCLELVQLDVRDEPLVSESLGHAPLKMLDARRRVRLAFGFVEVREVRREPEQVEHGREVGVRALILLHPPQQVSAGPAVVQQAAAMDSRGRAARFHAAGVRENAHRSKMLHQHRIDETFLGLPLDDHVQAGHRAGLPPMTFFSQSSAMEYSSSQSFNLLASSVWNSDSRPARSTTTISSGSKQLTKAVDWVATIT